MTGASISVVDVVPNLNKKVIYFSGTTDADKKLDFSAFKSVDSISAVVAATLVSEAVSAYSAGGDITFTSSNTAIKGIAVVNV